MTSDQSIADDTDTVMVFDDDSSAGFNDVGSNYGTGTGLFIAPQTGYYNFSGNVVWASNATGYRQAYIAITSSSGASNVQILSITARNSVATGITTIGQTLSATHVYVTSGQEVCVKARQTSGGNLNANGYFGGQLIYES
jgi:hypothetical protein